MKSLFYLVIPILRFEQWGAFVMAACRNRLWIRSALLAVWSFAPPAAASPGLGSTQALEVDAVRPFPDGCGNPFSDAGDFISFFESSVSQLAAKRGPDARGVVDLFSVSEIRSELTSSFGRTGQDAVLERLIVGQLCNFSRIALLQAKSQPIDSADDRLMDHLAGIAPRLYRDARAILLTALDERRRLVQKESLLSARAAEVQRARALARSRVKELLGE
jgi:hypothetical protein